MKKRNQIKVLGTMVVIAAIGIGSTLAYLTDKTDTLHNTFSIGDVSIALKESAVESCDWGFKDSDGDNTWTVDFSQDANGNIKNSVTYDGLVAGDFIYKDPTVFPVASVSSTVYAYLGNCEVVNEDQGIIQTKAIASTDKSLEFTLDDYWEIYEKDANKGIVLMYTGGGWWADHFTQGTSISIFKKFKDETTGAVYTAKLPNDFEEDSTFQNLTVQAMIIQHNFIENDDVNNLIKTNTNWLDD
ncbi:SipW-cognate class signal peptide [Acetitomaculum ruminis DSM 5522]|uniref:SipW-cognate class signal peptide n=1 Tax=Acetitomaculum ruminis DSM 5522 TaxID=1120918 RepID=A0A1I0XQS5_9FIRM|nr:SipW-dependent-type signal peptide-containing protein [Acetitomaculum ruminis]SFB03027.1 SipW-cognate class signal peptide [Acetitomaculum ruminis DSM 5522]